MSALLLALLAGEVTMAAPAERWTADRAWAWYRQQPWLVGCNYVPSTAANSTEFWQAESADPATWERELGWAAGLGFNVVRVFCQQLVWQHDSEGFLTRLDQFLSVAARHRVGVVPVLFDDCAFGAPPRGEPFLGPQGELIPGVLMPLWTPSPGLSRVVDPTAWQPLEAYVRAVIGRFAEDRRVVFWDLYNEPGNSGLGNRSLPLVEATFAWARAAGPSQPLTVGVWGAPTEISARQLELSDLVSFHAYRDADGLRAALAEFSANGRPVVCTEYLARLRGGNWEHDLLVFRDAGAGCLSWGLVNGRTQTQFAWDSPPGSPEPTIWFHDLFSADGTPYDPREPRIIRQVTGRGTPLWATAALLPTAAEQPSIWRQTTAAPPSEWTRPEFDDAAWELRPAPFGRPEPGRAPRTEWVTGDLWLRRWAELPRPLPETVAASLHHDESVELYVNGVLALRVGGYNGRQQLFELSPAGRAALRPGRNLLAVHVRQTTGGQYLDLGLVAAESLPPVPDYRLLFDEPLRDPSLCLAPDGWYYLTGTTGWPTWWQTNEGIRVWRSRDLIAWEPLGLVWSFERDATWQAAVIDGQRAIWAPEIHYLQGTFYLAYCLNWPGGGTGLLRSLSGTAAGPYEDCHPAGPLTGEIDASLFVDDDGSVWFVYQNGKIARLREDLSGLAEPPRLLAPSNGPQVGFEGATIAKIDGRYHLLAADFTGDPTGYHCLAASSDSLLGPYGPRYVAVTHGGHNVLFRDRDGGWHTTLFGHDPFAPLHERPAVAAIRIEDRRIVTVPRDAAAD